MRARSAGLGGVTCALVGALAWSACASSPVDVLVGPTAAGAAMALGSEVALAAGESVTVQPAGVRFQFVGVDSDSRCPVDVQCIQAGSVRLTIRASGLPGAASGISRELTLETVPARDTVTVDRFVLRLVRVSPDARSTERIAADRYRAIVQVSAR